MFRLVSGEQIRGKSCKGKYRRDHYEGYQHDCSLQVSNPFLVASKAFTKITYHVPRFAIFITRQCKNMWLFGILETVSSNDADSGLPKGVSS